MVRATHVGLTVTLSLLSGAGLGAQSPTTMPFESGAFQIESVRDPIDDKVSMYAFVGDEQHFIAVGCASEGQGTIEVLLKFPDYIGFDRPGLLAGGTTLQYRFDDAPAEQARWYSSDHVVSTGEHVSPDEFVAGLRQSARVYVRAISRAGDSSQMGFEFPDADPIVAKVINYCVPPRSNRR